MTDEEMAEQYVSNQGDDNILYFGEDQINLSSLKREAFLAGLKAGKDKTKWHKVADGDLPKGEDAVLIYWKAGDIRCFSVVEPYKVTEDKYIIAWCELPKYTEEE